jgi:hypothetical protein
MMKKIATIMAIVFAVCLFMTGQSIAAEEQSSWGGQTDTRTEACRLRGSARRQTQQTPGAARLRAPMRNANSWMTGLGRVCR